MGKKIEIPINPEVLKWALKESGYTKKELVNKLRIDEANFNSWINGNSKPGSTEFKNLAKYLQRPTAAFFLPTPPKSLLPNVEFRNSKARKRESLNHMETIRLREVIRLLRGISWIKKELDHRKIDFREINISENPEEVAKRLRIELGISTRDIIKAKNPSQAFELWRKALANYGVFVFKVQMGKDSARGFSIWDEYAPVIAVNTAWITVARIYTIFHELGHLLTRRNSICLNMSQQILSDHNDLEERWCEYFSASFLLPWNDLTNFLSKRHGWDEGTKIVDIEVVRSISTHFKVSMRASALRLIDRNVADWKLYSEIPSVSDNKSKQSGGPAQIRHDKKLSAYGENTFNLFLNAVESDVMTRSDALSYLDTTDSEFSSTA